MRECWVLEEHSTGEGWYPLRCAGSKEAAEAEMRAWPASTLYPKRVVRYVHADTLAAKDAEIAVLKGIHADVYAAAFADGKREADAEIADLTTRLHWFMAYPCHWTRTEIEYRTDCGQVAFPVSKTPDGKCHGCGRPIVVSVPA